jgi:hypothetical protein
MIRRSFNSQSNIRQLINKLREKTNSASRVTTGLPLNLLDRFSNSETLIQALTEANSHVDLLLQKHGV